MNDFREVVENTKDYTEALQKNLIEFILSSEESYTRCQNILNYTYFDAKFRTTIKYIKKFAEEYNALPKPEQIEAELGIHYDLIEGIDKRHISWLLDEVEQFCRHKALENAILAAPDKLEKGQYSDVETQVKEAILVGLQKDLGINYYEDVKGRLLKIRDKEGIVSTGWKDIDKFIGDGFSRGGLNIIAGNSGSGKSLFLQNYSVNMTEIGLNVVYISLELSELLTAARLDSIFTNMPGRLVYGNPDKVELLVAKKARQSGKLQIKYMNPGSCANDIKAYLKEYEIQTGVHPDVIVVDYLDIMGTNNQKVDPSNLFTRDKYIAEELRSLANEWNCLLFTASQLNRSSVEEQEHDHSHIAGGLSKINTADNVMTIFTSKAMRDRGEYIIQFIKTRNANGVGNKIVLKFDKDSLKITNSDGDDADVEVQTIEELTNQLRTKQQEVSKQSVKPNVVNALDKINLLRRGG